MKALVENFDHGLGRYTIVSVDTQDQFLDVDGSDAVFACIDVNSAVDGVLMRLRLVREWIINLAVCYNVNFAL